MDLGSGRSAVSSLFVKKCNTDPVRASVSASAVSVPVPPVQYNILESMKTSLFPAPNDPPSLVNKKPIVIDDLPSPPETLTARQTFYDRPLPKILTRPTPFSAIWVISRLRDCRPELAAAHLRIFAHPRRRREVDITAVEEINKLPPDDALRAVHEFKNPRVFVRGTTGRKLELKAAITTLDDRSVHATQALIDSGCEGSCIDIKFVRERGLNTKKLPRPIHVLNADGTPNEEGPISEYITLEMRIGDHIERLDFGVTNLGRGQVFLSFDWLKLHNPQIDWREGLVEFDRCLSRCRP